MAKKAKRKPKKKPKGPVPVNWDDITVTINGGKLEEIPKPHVFLYRDDPKKRKRLVRIKVMKYYGAGVHFFVDIEAKGEAVWDSKEGTWCHPWDIHMDGESRESKFNTIEAAEAFIELTLKDTFPEATHEYRREPGAEVWLDREGD